MTKLFRSFLSGVGHYVPETIVTNNDLAQLMETSDEWIRERTGIEERRHFTPGVDTCANMGIKAAQIAIERAGLTPHDIEFIVFATLSPDYFFPGSGVLVQKELMGGKTVGALDVRDQCSGFVYALSVADQFVKTGMYKHILVIGSEIHSTGLDMTTRGRGVSVIFGDGAGAAVVSRCEDLNSGILSTHLHSEGQYAEELAVLDPGSSRSVRLSKEMIDEATGIYPYMNGNYVFKHAVTRFPEVIHEALTANGLHANDIDLLVPHQANLRITNYIKQVMNLPDEKVVSNIHKYGNTTAASIPIALSEAWEAGRIQTGDLVCLAAFGSGFTWASALLKW